MQDQSALSLSREREILYAFFSFFVVFLALPIFGGGIQSSRRERERERVWTDAGPWPFKLFSAAGGTAAQHKHFFSFWLGGKENVLVKNVPSCVCVNKIPTSSDAI
jgi:hypothetical protein